MEGNYKSFTDLRLPEPHPPAAHLKLSVYALKLKKRKKQTTPLLQIEHIELAAGRVTLLTATKLDLIPVIASFEAPESDEETPDVPIIIKNTSSVDQNILLPWLYPVTRATQGMSVQLQTLEVALDAKHGI
jgi:hypothetical protein